MTLAEISTIFGIALSIGGIIGVYVNMQVKLGILNERIKQQDNSLKEHKQNHKEFSEEIKEMFSKIFDKMSLIEKELSQKADIHSNGQKR